MSEADKAVNTLWEEFDAESDAHAGAQRLERTRQQENAQVRSIVATKPTYRLFLTSPPSSLQSRIAAKRLRLLRKKVSTVEARLAARRASAQAKQTEVRQAYTVKTSLAPFILCIDCFYAQAFERLQATMAAHEVGVG